MRENTYVLHPCCHLHFLFKSMVNEKQTIYTTGKMKVST